MCRNSMRGQAMVEYILMLVVTLTLVIGVATKLVPQLKKFMENYAGAYVVCLLETGELPPPLTTRTNPQCTIENMEASGRLNASGGGSGSGGSSSGSSDSSRNDNSNSTNTNAGNQSRGRPSRNAPRQQTGANTGTDGNATGSGAANSASKSGDKLASAANSASNRTNGAPNNDGGVPYSVQQDRGSAISGYVKAPRTGNLKDKNLKPTTKLKKDSKIGGENLRKGSFSAPISKDKKRDISNMDDIELGFQFGKYLRFFIIGGLLLALILMVGTQINSLRKSWGAN